MKSFNEINTKYDEGNMRLFLEYNRVKLPNLVEMLKGSNYEIPILHEIDKYWGDNWDDIKQSRLIESFLVNIPVPGLIVDEQSKNIYKILDGKERVKSIIRFYENNLRLSGMQLWPELNGMFYKDLPENIKLGIDRRSIEIITITISSSDDLKQRSQLLEIAVNRINGN